MFAQLGSEVDDDDFFAQIASFMAQLSDEEVDSMESYLMQMEEATEKGDSESLA